MDVVKLKSKFPTAKQIADGIEFESPLKTLPGWVLYVQYDLTADPKDDDAWIDDFLWAVKKPANGKKRRRIYLGTQQLGFFSKLDRLPSTDAQFEFQKYAKDLWDKKLEATGKEIERRWAIKEVEGDDDDECFT